MQMWLFIKAFLTAMCFTIAAICLIWILIAVIYKYWILWLIIIGSYSAGFELCKRIRQETNRKRDA